MEGGQLVTAENGPNASNEKLSGLDMNPQDASQIGTNLSNTGEVISCEPLNGSAGELESNYQLPASAENGHPTKEEGAPAAEQNYVDANSAEEDRLWSMVMANCLDFNAWTSLIEETERVSENNILKIRKVYDTFLAEFPLCFGYWKKYADHEGRLGSVDKVVEVYERAVNAVTYSVDIWLHYCVFAISTYQDPDIIRRLFERGLAFVGSDYLSHPLWDEYIRYEEAQQAWLNIAMIYTRILENPIQQLDRYFNCFKEFVGSHSLSEIRTTEEASITSIPTNTEGSDVEQSNPNDGLTEALEVDKYIEFREDLYKKAKEYESKIIDFELGIRRPYFHVRPLDALELENWHKYLNFMENEEDFNKVIKLYERCLIACANYPEFWIRYVLHMEFSGNMELAYNALARATHIFVKKQPEIHLFAAKFKEFSGDIEGAREQYQYLYSEISPCLLEAIVKHANMEYHAGVKEAAYSVYNKIISAEKEKEQSKILPMLLVHYSRFLYLVDKNLEKAREVLFEFINEVQLSKPLLEAAIHLETIQPHSKNIDLLDSLVEKFILPSSDDSNAANASDREEISCIFMEFLDMFGNLDIRKKAEKRHSRIFLCQRSSLLSKKRKAEDSLASDKTKVSNTSTDTPSYPSAQNQWAAAYMQNPQAQGQQWNAGYAAQAAYGAYGYPNYVAPQTAVQTSTPQTAAFGAYPATYPAQTYPQQSYAQPAAAVATYTQQPAVASVPYPTTYY